MNLDYTFPDDDMDSIDSIDYLYDTDCYNDLIIALMPFYNDSELLVYLWGSLLEEHKEYILDHHKSRMWLKGNRLLINNVWLF